MKRITIILILTALILALVPAVALADSEVPAGYDANDFSKLRTFLNQPSAVSEQTNGQRINAAYNPLDPTTWTDVKWSSTAPYRVESIGVTTNGLTKWYSNSLAGPLDLSGFSQLTTVIVTSNKLTSLDLSGASVLETIYLFDNNINSLTFSGNIALENVYCSNNNLTALDLSGAPNLTGIQCNSNKLSSLNVTANAALQNLSCSDNQLTSLDVSNNAMLTTLHCGQNLLTQLNVRHNSALTSLSIYYNQFAGLDVSANPLLEALICNDNLLTALDIRANTALTQLVCNDNALTALDISRNTALTRLLCHNNQIAYLSFATNPALTYINCRGNRLASLDLRALTALEELDCSDNRLTSIRAVHSGRDISVNSNGKGYVELRFFNPNSLDKPQVTAVPCADAPFMRWTDSGAVVSETQTYTLTAGVDHLLTAHFLLSLSPSVPSGEIYTGRSFTLTPNIPGGTWQWDETFFSATFNSPATFTPLKTGTSTITYTFESYNQSFEVAVAQKLSLSASVPDGSIYTGGRIELTPNLDGGTWEWDETFFSATFNSPATFTALKAGTSTITYTVGAQSQSFEVTVAQKLSLSESVPGGRIYTGGRIELTPNIEGGTWSYDSAFLSLSGNTFTALKAGTTRVTYAVTGQSISFDITIMATALPETGQDFSWVIVLGSVAVIALLGALLLVRRKKEA